MSKKVVAIVGSYRKNGVIDRGVEAILEGAREKGAETQTIYLADQHLEFCTNCRQCVQNPGVERGKCVLEDDLESILTQIEAADAIVLGSSVNFYNATALFRKFMERLLGYYYWPWGHHVLTMRNKLKPRKAVLVASAAIPGFLISIATGAPRALRVAANLLGARQVGALWIGQTAGEPHPPLSARTLGKARRLGQKLA
jgi:putative NADPH-quinone reductase